MIRLLEHLVWPDLSAFLAINLRSGERGADHEALSLFVFSKVPRSTLDKLPVALAIKHNISEKW